MKKVYLLIATFYMSAVIVQAQNSSDQASSVTMSAKASTLTEDMSQQLLLDEEQQSAVNQTWTEYFAGMQKLEQSDRMGRNAHRKAVLRLEQARDLKMKGILDEDQYVQNEDFLKERLKEDI